MALSPPILPRSQPHNKWVTQLVRVGGHRLAFEPVWIWDIPDIWVQSAISEGYKIKFLSTSLLYTFQLKTQGMVVPVSSEEQLQGFYSNLFTVLKPNMAIHSILKLKSLSDFLRTRIPHGIYEFWHCFPQKNRHTRELYPYSYFPVTPTLPAFFCGKPALGSCGTAIQALFCTMNVHKSACPAPGSCTIPGHSLDDLLLKDFSAKTLLANGHPVPSNLWLDDQL